MEKLEPPAPEQQAAPVRLSSLRYLRAMAGNFSTTVNFEGKSHLAIVVPSHRRDGMHYEVNITGYPRFWMHWGAMDRFEVVRPAGVSLPDSLVLAVSDAIEREVRR